MHPIILLTVVSISLVASSPFSTSNEFSLPSLENIESHIDHLWTSFKTAYGIVHDTSFEEIHRFKIFTNHVKMIIQHNTEHDLGLHTYRLGINKFATLVKMRINQKKYKTFLLDKSRIP